MCAVIAAWQQPDSAASCKTCQVPASKEPFASAAASKAWQTFSRLNSRLNSCCCSLLPRRAFSAVAPIGPCGYFSRYLIRTSTSTAATLGFTRDLLLLLVVALALLLLLLLLLTCKRTHVSRAVQMRV